MTHVFRLTPYRPFLITEVNMTPLNLPQWLQARHVATCLLLVVILALAACRSVTTATGACAAPFLGITTDENYQVIELYPEGAAAQAGVQIGDILISISPGPPLAPGEPIPTPFVCNDTINGPARWYWPLWNWLRWEWPRWNWPWSAASAATPTLIPPTSPLPTTTPIPGVIAQPSSPLAESTIDPIHVTPTPDVTYEAAWKPYHECMVIAMSGPNPSSSSCLAINPGTLTSTVYFTEGQWINWKISASNPSNRMLLKLRRGDQELEILVISSNIGWRRTTTQMQETPTPVPSDYHLY
jgi:hypothetical protein